MSNPILNSESFNHAVGWFGGHVDRLTDQQRWFGETADRQRETQERFAASVDKLVTAMGMQAENDQRKAIGASMAYVEADFAKL